MSFHELKRSHTMSLDLFQESKFPLILICYDKYVDIGCTVLCPAVKGIKKSGLAPK